MKLISLTLSTLRSAAFALLTTAPLLAATDVSGTWAWSTEGRNGDTWESSLILKQEGSKITGTYKARGNESPIQEAKLNGKELTFHTTRETPNGSFTAHYKADVDSDSLQGTIAMKFGDRDFERPWIAKREAVDPSGVWAWTMARDDGDDWKANLTLKRDGDSITGAFTQPDSDFKVDVRNGKMKGSTLTFETVMERDGSSITFKNSATIAGRTMNGKTEGSSPDGDSFTREWKATRK
ncbi:MAG: hypothetical protein K9N62_13550 [Verrucomicrobia bacterium]|nr:hypothetical protein [Verrucomicrobiota bacterium]